MSPANVALRKPNVALRNRHITGTKKKGSRNVALRRTNVALRNKYIAELEKKGNKSVALRKSNVALQKDSEITKDLVNFIKQEIRKDNTISRQEIADRVKVSKKTIERAIKEVPEIKYVGVGRHGHWELTE